MVELILSEGQLAERLLTVALRFCPDVVADVLGAIEEEKR